MSESKEKKGPPSLEELEREGRLPWKPIGESEYLDEQILYGHIVGFLQRYVSFQDPRYYDVVAAWILHTWHIRKWRATGPLYLLGPISSGKTTLLECLEELAYRGIRGGSMSNATMFRLSHAYTPTLLVDESQIYNREEYAETQAFLNERYRKGGRVWRMEGEGRNMVPTFFEAYGATAFAGSHPPWEAMENRALLLMMEKGQPEEQTLTDGFFEEGAKLRGQLARYGETFQLPRKEGPETERDTAEQALIEEGKLAPRQPTIFPDPTLELASIHDPRVREIGYPLMVVTPQEARLNILGYLGDLERDHEAAEKGGYLADYVHALDMCMREGGKVSAKEVRLQLATLWDLKTDSKDLPKPRTVMAALKTLHFQQTRVGAQSLAGIIWDERLMERLRLRYSSPVSPVSSVHEGKTVKSTDDTDDTGHGQGDRLDGYRGVQDA